MKKYSKPEVKVLDMSLTNSIAAMNVSANAANFDNVDQNTWAEWGNLFGNNQG